MTKMTRILLLAASLGLAVSGAQACDFMRSAAKVDTNTTASVSKQETQPPAMSTPETVATAEPAQSTTVVVPQSE
jgi:hypothetical protein